MQKRQPLEHMKEEKKERHFPAAAIIPYLLMAVVLTTLVSFSRYTSTGSATAYANLADWDVRASSADHAPGEFYLTKDEPTGIWELSVTNAGGVSVEYDVVVVFPEALPDSIKLTLDGIYPVADGKTYTFVNAGTIPVGGGRKTHTLTITARDFYSAIDQTGIEVSVAARQAD